MKRVILTFEGNKTDRLRHSQAHIQRTVMEKTSMKSPKYYEAGIKCLP